MAAGKDSELLRELEALSQTLYQSHTARRTNSLILPRSSTPNHGNQFPDTSIGQSDRYVPVVVTKDESNSRSDNRPRPSRRMSMSPWRSRPPKKSELKQQQYRVEEEEEEEEEDKKDSRTGSVSKAVVEEKKGIWNWKPMRALSHISMQKMGCLFSVEVVTIQGLPASMNGLRLSVSVRKKETKDGTVQTMPSRVLQGTADFEETMFIRCNVYLESTGGKIMKFEPRPFLISVTAIDALELNLGKNTVDLSVLIKDSMEKSLEGARIRHWDRSFRLVGKANGGELVVKLGFQIMEDGGVALYSQQESSGKRTPMKTKGSESPYTYARKQSKSSFSITSPRIPAPSKSTPVVDYKEIDDFKLDEPEQAPALVPSVETKGEDDHDFPEFEVLDKGIEVEGDQYQKKNRGKQQQQQHRRQQQQEEEEDSKSISSEAAVVKEVVTQDPVHQMRLNELDSIANQIKVLEKSMVVQPKYPSESNLLNADEESVTREFLNMLELEEDRKKQQLLLHLDAISEESDKQYCFVSDLGKGLGPVVQTKDGGFLVSVNPFDVEVPRKETPLLAIQISKPFVLLTDRQKRLVTGFEVFQRMAACRSPQTFVSNLMSVFRMDDLTGKTAELMAFEGIAAEIISGRHKQEGASSSAAKLVATLNSMSSWMSVGRKERTKTGIWNAAEAVAVSADEVISSCVQKIESMAVEGLKIQGGMAEEESPFDVSPDDVNIVKLDSMVVPMEEWNGSDRSEITVMVVIQSRDPVRRYEKVGGPIVAMIQAVGVGQEGKYKIGSVHVGGLKTKDGDDASSAVQWLNGIGAKKKWKSRTSTSGGGGGGGGLRDDAIWSLSSSVMAGMWLKPIRNPDVKFHK